MKYRKLLQFVRGLAVDLVADQLPNLLLPGVGGILFKVCQHTYACFIAADPKDKLAILDEARGLTEGELNGMIDALTEGWKDRLPDGKLTDQQRQYLRDLVESLQAAAEKKSDADQADELKKSLNRTLGGGNLVIAPLSPGQLALGRTIMTRILSDSAAGRGRRPLPPNAPAIPDHTLNALIGDGGFARVFLATHTSGELRAVKVGRLDEPKRFHDEVVTLQKLAKLPPDAPLVRYRGHGTLPGAETLFWIAMEYLGDTTLADLLTPTSRPDTVLTLHLADQILRGLGELHKLKLIHRDLKPENVMVDGEFRVRLIDFGLAKPAAQLGVSMATHTTGSGGTALYASPEQVAGGRLSFTTDVWSFGCVLYQLFTGDVPFRPKTIWQVSETIRNTKLSFNRPEIPMEMRAFLTKCLAQNPDERLADAVEALAEMLPLKKEVERRTRHERYREIWLSILDKKLLEQFASMNGGKQPADAVGMFAAYVEQQGCARPDQTRLAKILPPIFERQARVDAARKLIRAKDGLRDNVHTLDADKLKRTAENIARLEEEFRTAQEAVTNTVRNLLKFDIGTWSEKKKELAKEPREKPAIPMKDAADLPVVDLASPAGESKPRKRRWLIPVLIVAAIGIVGFCVVPTLVMVLGYVVNSDRPTQDYNYQKYNYKDTYKDPGKAPLKK